MPDTCHRCNNQLGLGMAILEFSTIANGKVIQKICSACNSDLQRWFTVYESHLKAKVD